MVGMVLIKWVIFNWSGFVWNKSASIPLRFFGITHIWITWRGNGLVRRLKDNYPSNIVTCWTHLLERMIKFLQLKVKTSATVWVGWSLVPSANMFPFTSTSARASVLPEMYQHVCETRLGCFLELIHFDCEYKRWQAPPHLQNGPHNFQHQDLVPLGSFLGSKGLSL